MNARRLSGTAKAATVVLGVLLLTTACSSSGGSSSGNSGSASAGGSAVATANLSPIVVGAFNEGSGTAAFPDYAQGMNAAIGYINSLGGVSGHPLKLDLCNVDDTTTQTQACAQHFVQTKPAFVTVGIDNQLAVAYPLLAAAGIPLIGGTPVGTGDYGIKDTYYLNGGSLAVGAGITAFVKQYLPNVKTAGLVGIDIPVAKEAVDLTAGLLKADGITTTSVYVPITAQDYVGPLSSISKPVRDLYFSFTTGAGCLGLAKAAQSQGVKADFIAPGPCNDGSLIKSAGGAMTGWYVWSVGPDPKGDDPKAVIYRNALTKFGGSGALPGSDSLTTFGDLMTIYDDVLKPLGPSNITNAGVIQKITSPSGGTTFYGGTYKCGVVSKYPAVCNYQTRWYQVTDVNGDLKDATNGQYVDAAPLLG